MFTSLSLIYYWHFFIYNLENVCESIFSWNKITITYGSRVVSPKSLEVNLCNLNCSELGSLHGNNFLEMGFGLVLRVGLSISLNPTLNASPKFA